jgi:hypothetical protein
MHPHQPLREPAVVGDEEVLQLVDDDLVPKLGIEGK